MDRLTPELEHLTRMCTWGTAWELYAEWKAGAMAAKTPQDMGDLPMRLRTALALNRHGPDRPPTNLSRRSDVHGLRNPSQHGADPRH